MTYFRPRPPERLPDGFKFGLVTFADILGFSVASKALPRNEVHALLRARRTVASSALAFIGAPTLPREFVLFQDTMVRCIEIGYMREGLSEEEEAHHLGNWLSALMDELASLRELQLDFIRKGVPLRGAIAVGAYDTAESSVWGSAYERAAKLEATEAVYPRIILDEHLRGFLEYVRRADVRWVLENVRTDEGGVPYVDYLRGIAFECPGDMSAVGAQLSIHRDFIRRALVDHDDPSIVGKLRWLAHYHNAVVQELAMDRPGALKWSDYKC